MSESKTTSNTDKERGDLHGFAIVLEIAAAGGSLVLNAFLAWKIHKSPTPGEISLELWVWTAAANFALILSLFWLTWSYTRKERKLRKALIANARLEGEAKSGQTINTQMSQQRALIATRHSEYCERLRRALVDRAPPSIEEFTSYLSDILGMTAELFSVHTGAPCGACIKIFSTDDQQHGALAPDKPHHNVYTLQRDGRSRAQRRSTDVRYSVYPYSGNAAFRCILDEDDLPDWWAANDLKGLGREYYNRNKDWANFYNACVVVPVKPAGVPAREQCLGLLCVDNRHGGFHEERSVQILNGIASDLYYAMGTTVGLLPAENGKS